MKLVKKINECHVVLNSNKCYFILAVDDLLSGAFDKIRKGTEDAIKKGSDVMKKGN